MRAAPKHQSAEPPACKDDAAASSRVYEASSGTMEVPWSNLTAGEPARGSLPSSSHSNFVPEPVSSTSMFLPVQTQLLRHLTGSMKVGTGWAQGPRGGLEPEGTHIQVQTLN